MKMLSMNKAMLRLQQQWEEMVLLPYVKKYPHTMSRPFAYGVPEAYLEADCKIMVIGQEAAGFSMYEDESAWGLSRTQQWVMDYWKFQLFGDCAGDVNPNDYNRSPFWNMFRYLKKHGVIASWNNLDKVYQKHTFANDEKVIRLENDQRKWFNGAVCDGKTLLLCEIEMSKPDGIVFVTGPHYRRSMETALGCSENKLSEKRPIKKDPLKEITLEAGLGIPCYWTYHPAYLNRIGALKMCAEQIAIEIKTAKKLHICEDD